MEVTMVIGFTGTKLGMTVAQKRRLSKLLGSILFDSVAHGDCIGADAEFHAMAKRRGVEIQIFPPLNPKFRAFLKGRLAKPAPYLIRNRAIVDASDILLATPSGTEVLRSGTWATIRYARRVDKPRVVIYPDGRYSATIKFNLKGEL
jgi:hypothetical protein